jgi:hypothetical protein
MDEDEFRRLLQLGHGRAILYARDQGVEAFRNVILDACLHCRAYDAQIEGTRASYMLDLLDLMPGKESYYDEVLNALPVAETIGTRRKGFTLRLVWRLMEMIGQSE